MRSYTRTKFGSSQSGNKFSQVFSSHSNLNVPERVAVARVAHHLHGLHWRFFPRKALQCAVRFFI